MALFHQLATLAEHLAQTPSRLAKRAAIAAAIAAVHAQQPRGEDAGSDAGLFTSYLAGLPFAEHDPRKLNAGGALVSKAVAAVTHASGPELTAAYRRHGDLGAAAYDLLLAQPAQVPTLTLAELASTFTAMADARTTAVRAALVQSLLARASPIEAKFLVKLMLGDMRIGVKQSLIEEGIAVAAQADVAEVRHAVMLEADLAHATVRAFAGTLADARMTLFHPLGFMLASPVETPEDAVLRFSVKPAKVSAAPSNPKKGRERKEAARPDVSSVTLREDGETEKLPIGEDSPAIDLNKLHIAEDVNKSALEQLPIEEKPAIHAFLEDKFDGMRAQLHCGDPAQPGRVALYSRNREDITESFPELAEAFGKIAGSDLAADRDTGTSPGAIILDGEILGWDFANGRALPFAVLGQRIGRKRVSNETRAQVPVVFMAFDLLYDGALMLDLPLHARRNRLEAIVGRVAPHTRSPLTLDPRGAARQASIFPSDEVRGDDVPRLLLSPSRLVESAEDIDRAYVDARVRSNEGVMLKGADSTYQPGRRGLAWVKLKRSLATLDVVITGAEYGHGRRAPFLSDYTFAVRDPAHPGTLLNVGKAYSGVTDAEISYLTEFLKAHTLEDHGHFRTVEPLIILEVAFNNIMRSTRHASGFALRFPRILRLRPDKPLTEIDTLASVEAIYQSQVDKPSESATERRTEPPD